MSIDNFILASKQLEKICTDSNNGCEQLFCKLHEGDYLGVYASIQEQPLAHNCLACHLNEGVKRVYRFLKDLEIKEEEEIEYAFTIYILLLYLEVEKLHTIFKFIGITYEYVEENWKVLIEIRKWANFVKHPKGFLFTHHPIYIFENNYEVKQNSTTQIIDKVFVHKFYTREDEKKSKQIILEIGNKKDLIVVIPNPERIAEEYVFVCYAFCQKIKDNPHFKEVLSQHTTIEDY